MPGRWRKLTLDLAFLGQEACWIYAFTTLVAGEQGPSLAMIFGLLGMALLAGELLQHLDFEFPVLRALAVGAAALTIGGALGLRYGFWYLDPGVGVAAATGRGTPAGLPLAFSLALGVVLWWRGLQLARSPRSFDVVLGSFLWGFGVLIGALALAAASGVNYELVAPLVLPFFLLGLLALALARLEQVGYGQEIAFTGYWAGLLGATILAVALLGGVVALLFGLELWLWPRIALGFVASFLLQVLFVFLLALGFVVQLLIVVLQSVLRPLVVQFPVESPTAFLEELQERTQQGALLSPLVQEILKGVLLFLLIGVVALFLAWAFGRRQRSLEAGEGVSRESLGSAQLLWVDLWTWVRSLWRRWRGHPKAAPQAAETWARGEGAAYLLSIRRLYLSLLELAAARGVSRRTWQTPREFQGEMTNLLGWSSAMEITVSFEAARYGAVVPEPQVLGHLNRLWQRLRIGVEPESTPYGGTRVPLEPSNP